MSRPPVPRPHHLRLSFLLIITLLFFTGCGTPWYINYGISTEKDLYSASSIPALTQALQDKNPSIRILAAIALKKIEGDVSEAITPLTEAASDPHRNVRRHVLEALRIFSSRKQDWARDAILAFTQTLGDIDGNLRIHAIESLRLIGTSYQDLKNLVIHPLKDSMVDKIDNVSFKALKAVNELEPGSQEAIPIFKTLLTSNDASMRRYTILELQEEYYPKEVLFSFVDHLANHDPRATVRRDALLYLIWGKSTARTPEVAATREPYLPLAKSAKGYIQFEMNFTNGDFPLSPRVRRIIEGFHMPPYIFLGKPIPERPGTQHYRVFIEGEDSQDITLVVEKGKITVCKLNLNLVGKSAQPTQPGTHGELYLFTASTTILPPVTFTP